MSCGGGVATKERERCSLPKGCSDRMDRPNGQTPTPFALCPIFQHQIKRDQEGSDPGDLWRRTP